MLLLCGAVFFGGLEILRPFYFLHDDNATFFLPSYLHGYRALAEEGELAHVNLHQYLGQIHLGNGQSGVLYPPIYPAIFLAELTAGDPRPAIDLLAIAHLLFGGLGFFVLLRELRVSRWIAVVGALSWLSFPFPLQVAKNWIVVAYAASLLPWNVWLLGRLLAAPRVGWALALGAVKALFFFQGYPQFLVMTSLFDVAYALVFWVSTRPGWRRTGGAAFAWAGAQIAGILLAAPLLLPMLEAKNLSAHRADSLTVVEFLANALPIRAFLEAQVFSMQPRVIHLATGALFYVGLPVLALVALALALPAEARSENPQPGPRAWVLLAGLGFLTATTAWAVVHPLPLLGSFRWHFKNFLFFLFFALPAAALAADRLRCLGRPWRWLGVVALASSFPIHFAILVHPDFDRAFGPHRLDRGVDEIRAETAARIPIEEGRVASLWIGHGDPEMYRRLTFNYATLTGARHLAGYDPLIARDNLDLALGLEVDSSFRRPLDPAVAAHLSAWSVRWLIVPGREEVRRHLAAFPALQFHGRGHGLEIWENRAAWPYAHFVGAEGEGLEIAWEVNAVRIDPGGRSGRMRLTLAPLPWWVAEIDGEPAEIALDPGRHLLIDVPPGAREVVVRYRNVPFRLGAGLASVFALAALAWALRRRLRA